MGPVLDLTDTPSPTCWGMSQSDAAFGDSVVIAPHPVLRGESDSQLGAVEVLAARVGTDRVAELAHRRLCGLIVPTRNGSTGPSRQAPSGTVATTMSPAA